MHILLAPISTRNQFGQIIVGGKNSIAVEIGTHRGEFARNLLSSWEGTLYCIDPWADPPGYEEQAESLIKIGGSGDRDVDYESCKRLLGQYRSRVIYMRCLSHEAVLSFANNTLDFVYIDGDHLQDKVSQDLAIWYPKLRVGGILAGHDFLCPGEYNGGWGRGIQLAVQRFSEERNLDVYIVAEEGGLPWSYYMIKHND